MKIAGMVPGTKQTLVALVEGCSSAPTRLDLSPSKLKTPCGELEPAVLQSQLRLVATWLGEHTPDKVVVLGAGNNRFGANSKLRTKIEAMIQLACIQRHIECTVLAAQTLRAQQKRFAGKVGTSIEESLNAGQPFKPKPLQDAVLTAWCGLPDDAA